MNKQLECLISTVLVVGNETLSTDWSAKDQTLLSSTEQ